MQFRSRALVVAAFGAAPLLLVTACAGGGTTTGSASNLTPIAGSSYVTIEPATTTTTTTTIAPPTDGAVEPGQTSPVEQLYTVKSGDSLSRIASSYGLDMQTICTYNSWPDCGGDHLLLPGDVVRIPPESLVPVSGGGQVTTGTPAPETATGGDGDTGTTGSGCTYTIQAGDYPGTVAEKFGITFDQLQAANPTRDFSSWFLATATINIPPEGDCG